jgi:hypothetical protein
VENIRIEFFKWCYNETDDYVISRQELFLAQCDDGKITSTSITKTVLAKFFLKYVWDCRNRYCLPNLDDAKEIVKQDIISISSVSKKMKDNINDSGLAGFFLQG